MEIGKTIKRLRVLNNVTQEELASQIGVFTQAVSRQETGVTYPDIALLPILAAFFSVSTDELLGYKISEREETLKNIKIELH